MNNMKTVKLSTAQYNKVYSELMRYIDGDIITWGDYYFECFETSNNMKIVVVKYRYIGSREGRTRPIATRRFKVKDNYTLTPLRRRELNG